MTAATNASNLPTPRDYAGVHCGTRSATSAAIGRARSLRAGGVRPRRRAADQAAASVRSMRAAKSSGCGVGTGLRGGRTTGRQIWQSPAIADGASYGPGKLAIARHQDRPPKGSCKPGAAREPWSGNNLKASGRSPAPAIPAGPPAIRERSGTATACLWRGMPPSACGLVPTSGTLQPCPFSSDRSRMKA